MKKYLSVLGSTGSIGGNTLRIVDKFPERYKIKALAAGRNIDLLARQIRRFDPDLVAVIDEPHARRLETLMVSGLRTSILWGDEGYRAAAVHADVDLVVAAMVGAAGLRPALAAIAAGKDIALANKETLVMAGDVVMDAAARQGVRIVPIDSEHSAIFQCLAGNRRQDLDRILLTASGGPFRERAAHTFAGIRPEDALRHPNWQMGPKISVDSATLMNKGLEVIEARCLFELERDQIQVVVHPQSIVHSMVAYRDGSIMAQLGVPDMRTAIAFALSYPERLDLDQPLPDFAALGSLTFQAPDMERFPCLRLAFEACDRGHTLPAVLNAANEVAVAAFLDRRIGFIDIPGVIERTLQNHTVVENPDLEAIVFADQWAREQAATEISKTIKPTNPAHTAIKL